MWGEIFSGPAHAATDSKNIREVSDLPTDTRARKTAVTRERRVGDSGLSDFLLYPRDAIVNSILRYVLSIP